MPASAWPLATSKHGSDPQLKQWSSLVGIITAIVGNILISFALNTQRYAHIRIDREYKLTHDRQAKKARKNLPRAIRNYGAAIQQEEVAEERQRANADAPGPGEGEINLNEDQPLLPNSPARTQSDDTLKAKENGEDEEWGRKSYLKSPWWWLGIILMTIGEAGNFLAYGFAPASIVSPLGVVALISNCLIAPWMLKERFRQRDFWGVAIAVAGAVTVVLSANQSEQQLGPGALWKDVKRWEFLAYVLITAVLMGVLMAASPKYGQRTILIDLGLVGLFGGYTVLSTKGVASLLSASLYRAFTYPIFYILVLILVASAIMQIRYLNRALQIFDSTQVIPVQFVLFTLSVIIGSAILYRDFQRTTPDHAVKFVVGCALTFSGVYLITSGRKGNDDDDGDDGYDNSLHEQDQIQLYDEEAAAAAASEEDRTPRKAERAPEANAPDGDLGDGPRTPKQQHSRSSSQIPSISVTPVSETPARTGLGSDFNQNPWLSSTDHLDGIVATNDGPQTPVSQSLPAGESSGQDQTPFYTPATTLHMPRREIIRTNSSPGSPETPTRQPLALSRPDADPRLRGSISRFIPGPLMPPLSSSLSGIIAESIRRGEGSPGSTRAASLRRHRSGREPHARRTSVQPDGDLPTPATRRPGNVTMHSASASESNVASPLGIRSVTATATTMPPGQAQTASSMSTASGSDSISGGMTKDKGRLRSMSETLSGLMSKARGKPSESGADFR